MIIFHASEIYNPAWPTSAVETLNPGIIISDELLAPRCQGVHMLNRRTNEAGMEIHNILT